MKKTPMFRSYKLSVLLALAMALLIKLPLYAQFGTVVYSDEFNSLSAAWKPIGLAGGTGSIVVEDGSLKATATAGSIYGTYYSTSFAGHFEAEIEIDEDHGVGLALLKDIGGNPSLADYSMITVMTNGNGVPVIQLRDRQNGTDDVLDNTNKVQDNKFSHLLDGNLYSVPFTKTSKKIKIFRHSQQQFFHFYYSVEKEVDGKIFEDWIELSPSKEWGVPNGKYFVGLFSLEGTTAFKKVTVSDLPLKDKSDINTGFVVTKRPYTWSGFTDDALVVTFGDAFPFKADDRKFVFWDLTNNIPVWHLNNGALMSHGFLETWDDLGEEVRVKGCIEPMSDRLLAFVDLEVVEDNAVRKVIKWTYEIVNPDYKYPVFGLTTQRAEATEFYYIYADGSIVRKAEYEHTIHPDFRNWYEVTELIVVAGENQQPRSLFETPSLTFHELGKTAIKHNNLGATSIDNGSARLGAVALTAHVKNAPELFYSFSDDPAVPETNSSLPFTYDLSWHNRNLDFGHWPVNKEPYNSGINENLCINFSNWPQHISHASFIGVGVKSDQAWDFTFQTREDGTTKYRQFLMLMGMNARGSSTTVEDKTNSWLFPGDVEMTNDSSSFKGYSHQDKYFKFETTKSIPACYFKVLPKTKLVNPIINIKGWTNSAVFVNVDGKPLTSSQYDKFIDANNNLLLLVIGSYSENVRIEISSRPIADTSVVTGLDEASSTKSSIHVYPNPSDQNVVNIVLDDKETVELVVLSMIGSEILRTSFESDRYQLNTDSLPAGSYLLRIKYGADIATRKIVIR
jgi:Secretion system C-terminal sorting domain